MSAVPAEPDVTPIGQLRECAADGCTIDSVGAEKHGRRGRGLDAFCVAHKAERVAELTRSRIRAAELRAIDDDGAGIYETRVRRLEHIARDLDQALAAEAEAAAHAADTRNRYRNAIVILARDAGVLG